MVNEFKVGDQVAHEEYGNGEVKEADGFLLWCWFDDITPAGRYCRRGELRPRNFLSKIAEEQNEKEKLADQIYQNTIDKLRADKTFDQQFNEVFKDAAAHGTGVMKDGNHIPHNEVFRQPTVIGVDMASGPDVGLEAIVTPQGFKEFITDAYGIKRDPVTLLEIESDGLVKISSIRDSVREIS